MKSIHFQSLIVSVLLLGAVFATFWLHGKPLIGIDDANIFFTYAENLASGEGIVYGNNTEPVEGFTSFIWMLMCSGIFAMGLDETTVLLLSCCLLLLTQMLFMRVIRAFLRSDENGSLAYLFYIVLLLASPGYVTWMTITLMDSVLWGLVVAALIFFMVIKPRSSLEGGMMIGVYALAPLVRPEALLVVPALACITYLVWLSNVENRQTRVLFVALGSSFVSALCLIGFRLVYFGYPFPNTYYAKVSPSLWHNLRLGRIYFDGFVHSSPIIGSSVLLMVLCVSGWFGIVVCRICVKHVHNRLQFLPASRSIGVMLAGAVLLILPILTGGDHFSLFRFYQPVYPILCMVPLLCLFETNCYGKVEHWWCQWVMLHREVTLFVFGIFFIWLCVNGFNLSWSDMRWGGLLKGEFHIAEAGIEKGLRLSALFEPTGEYPVLGVIPAGGIARTYKGKIVDLLGLNNLTIAHNQGMRTGHRNHAAFEMSSFFVVKPDVILENPPVPPATGNVFTAFLKGLHVNPEFYKRWRYGTLIRKDDMDQVKGFWNAEFLEKIIKSGAYGFHDDMVWRENRWELVHETM